MINKKRVLIIGAGISGLTTGYLLSKKNYEVKIIDKERKIGGLLASTKIEGSDIERTYHHIFTSDSDILWLIKDLKLDDKLIWKDNSIGLWWKKVMYPFNGSIDLLRFSPLSLKDKIRSGIVALWLMMDKKYEKYEKIKAIEWLEKWNGKKATEVIWKPLLQGKFHKYYSSISMVWMWARIHTRGNSKKLGYLNGGFGQIVDRLEEEIEKKGGITKPLCCIATSTLDEGEQINKDDYDLVIDTRPAEGINYLGAITLIFSTKQNLSPYYWHNINDSEAPFLAFIQHTNMVDKKEYNNKHIYYLGKYLPQNHEYFEMSDKKISKIFFDYLKNIYPEFNKEKIGEIKIFKYKYAQHIVDIKYRNKIPAYKIDNKNYQLNFSQIYPMDRGINFAVKEAKKLVELIEHSN